MTNPSYNSAGGYRSNWKGDGIYASACSIDQCVNAEHADGIVNKYLVSDCVKRASLSGNEVPIDVSVTISRLTGELTMQRRQDNNTQHDTLHDGSCKVFKPLF
jgi:hypothetical protein